MLVCDSLCNSSHFEDLDVYLQRVVEYHSYKTASMRSSDHCSTDLRGNETVAFPEIAELVSIPWEIGQGFEE